ncbi:substrate-binding domain-containing protein [Pseudomonas fontis]|uniref:Substrate-binding domain-containing protein n=1 Tax=Pseudomonas fontis TaxID=2942633 RepID=A0ABT5NPW8_9PSED|nr:substrate-binding domain-containing protein [Pseudomonas fontis]MDD0974715.1 substrate-binding domain-containing protein [Pseudomonas fontis]MDD0990210.1 substrate-binding domain-containing protein [Pseudomonas fontis]
MFKRNVLAVSLTLASLCSAQAMAAIVGGGATLPADLYNTPGVLTTGFNAYIGVGSGNGKAAVLNNDATKLNLTAGTPVDYAGSDSVLSASEITTYANAHQSPAVPVTDANNWGPLVQIPSAATSVTIPYKIAGVSNLNLTSAQLCDIFSGTVSNWSQVDSSLPNVAITVVYRSGSSGTSELLSRHLNSQCAAKFVTSSTFTTANVGAEPGTWLVASGSADMASKVAATEGAIGYVGPEDVDATNNAVVARVNGLLPTVGNVQTALATIAPPATDAERADLNKWAPVLPNPATGYSIVGYTNFIFGRCYKTTADAGQVRNFLNRHYGTTTNNDAAIVAKNLIPLSSAWKDAVRNTFATTSNTFSINHASVCNGIGRL